MQEQSAVTLDDALESQIKQSEQDIKVLEAEIDAAAKKIDQCQADKLRVGGILAHAKSLKMRLESGDVVRNGENKEAKQVAKTDAQENTESHPKRKTKKA